MKASQTNLQPIIEGTKQYIVPLFQRSYSWGKKEWEILWDDLMDLCEVENPRTHFMGSIVTIPADSIPEGVPKFSLIDGQQRLTTIFILLTLLRDKAKQINQIELAEEINNTLLVNPYKKGLERYKLLPTQVDRDSFQKLIYSEPRSGEDQITSAYAFFEKKLNKLSNFDNQKLKKVISTNLSVVSIVLEDDNPHLVFESLNAKGRPLTQSDLIRNYFFMRIHTDQQEQIYSQYWQPMQQALNESLTEYIRHYLMKDGVIIKQNEVYFYLKGIVTQTDSFSYLKDLTRFATYYKKLIDPTTESNFTIRQILDRLNRIEVTTAYPFLLNCYDDYAHNNLSLGDFVSVLKVIENFMIRRFVCGVPTNQLNKIFPSLSQQIKNKNVSNFVEGLKSVLQTKGYPKDTEFKARLIDAKLYGAGDRIERTKLILEAIEESYNHKEQVQFEKLTIEHIMPQTLSEWWKAHLSHDYKIVHDDLLHTLGNLTLTAYNAELSNDTFDSKKKRFCESHLEINKYFGNTTSWTQEDIKTRSTYLLKKALEIWPYFGDDQIENQIIEQESQDIETDDDNSSGHQTSCRESRELCEELFQGLNQLISNLQVSKAKGCCGFFEIGSKRFAYIYHRKTIGAIEIWCGGTLDKLTKASFIEFRVAPSENKKGWRENFPGRFILDDKAKIKDVVKLLYDVSYQSIKE